MLITQKLIIGKEEWCGLPDLHLPAIKARIDSGARTSALHAENIEIFSSRGEKWVRFDVNPIQKDRKITVHCRAPLVDERDVKSSSGHTERRAVIETTVRLGNVAQSIQLTLTNRDALGYRMLLGREAMQGRMLIDPEKSFTQGMHSEIEARQFYREDAIATPGSGLKIAVLASDRELYSNKRIMDAGRERGHTMRFVNIQHCYMNVSMDDPEIHYRGGEILSQFDAVIPRIRPAITFYGCAVLRQFEISKAYCLNGAVGITRSRDKLRTLQMLAQKSIPMPVTSFANSPQETSELIKMVGGAPVVVKLLEGTQGVGVVLAETTKAAEALINAFKSLKANILVQEFVKEAEGKDIRCFVIDDKVVASMQRIAPAGDFRANIHRGGAATEVKITAEERRIAIQSAKIVGLKVAGVDIIRSASGPKVLEINSSPGLEGIESTTGQDIAGQMIECIERAVARKRAKK
ncbi:MAG: 30S ribosomal protein S6--L-glutamate ligase [Alphaproteobacteria bacterium]|nr:30S ribosomal protein S6--L-glutamate ligase [Alphaproteobacteria bacterium]